MKKSLLTFVCAALVAGAVLSGCSKKDGAAAGADASLQKVVDAKKFVLGLDDAFPPMGFRDEANQIVGYDVDLAREACRRLGVEFAAQPINWDAKEQELSTGNIDCIWNGFTITEERKQAILYTPPYLKNAQVVVVNGGSPVQKLSDLAGKAVGTQQGSSSIDALDAHPEFKGSLKEVVEFQDFLTALMDLESGRLDGVVIDVVVAGYNITQSGKDFRILGENLGDESFGIGFRLGDKALEEGIWNALLEMAKDGTVAQIATKWFGSDISVIGK
ncbi:MAG: amino acid ABC transporter substrate-binding protein [Spirochaetaceae bacterium]|jgi:polar amino acid transport system substrate-binding protein|nr:amino acid ABC transporter substrate-binding protein [Spirochaetaceae bacterium]